MKEIPFYKPSIDENELEHKKRRMNNKIIAFDQKGMRRKAILNKPVMT